MKNLFVIIAVLISSASCQKIIETDNSLILVPPVTKGPEIVLFGLNGAFCDPHVYIGLFQTIQNYSNYTVWAALHKFPGDFPSDLDKAIPQTLDEVRQQGANTSTVFAVGHSLGAFMVQDFLVQNSTGIKGLVVLGKFIKFQYNDPQTDFPVPVLTISGELDGLSKISRLAMSYNQMLRHPKGMGHLYFPVAIIPGAFHSSYITGEIPEFINASDIKPEISNEMTWNFCASLIDAFVDAHLHIETAETNSGAKFLHDYVYGYTYNLMKPLLDAFALEGNPYLYNDSIVGNTKWVMDNIFDVMNISSKTLPTNVSAQDHDWYRFTLDKPTATMQNGVLNYQIYTQKAIGPVESDDMGNTPFQSAHWISVKFKSARYVYKVANLSSTPSQISCKALNQRAIDQVLHSHTIPTKVRERYQKYGVKLVAGDDIDSWTRATWHLASLTYEDNEGYMVVRSPRLYSEVDSWFSPGDFYCKLLSPARVIEWIYVDGLRKYDGAGVKNATLSFLE